MTKYNPISFALILILMSIVNLNPIKAVGQELDCQYGYWINPDTNQNECFGEDKVFTNITYQKNSYNSGNGIGSSLNDLGKSIADYAKLCKKFEMGYSRLSCINELQSHIDNYSYQCRKALSYESDVFRICRNNLDKISNIVDRY